jgi:hypothetical protein
VQKLTLRYRLLLLSMWGLPSRQFELNTSYLFVGLAMRIANDLGLHREALCASPSTDSWDAVNRQRAWFCAFSVDRSLSAQLGKPNAGAAGAGQLSRAAGTWGFHPGNKPWDKGVASFVELQTILVSLSKQRTPAAAHRALSFQSRQLEWLSAHINGPQERSDASISAALPRFNQQLDEWAERWSAYGFFSEPSSAEPAPARADNFDERMLQSLRKQWPIRLEHARLQLNRCALERVTRFARATHRRRQLRPAAGYAGARRHGAQARRLCVQAQHRRIYCSSRCHSLPPLLECGGEVHDARPCGHAAGVPLVAEHAARHGLVLLRLSAQAHPAREAAWQPVAPCTAHMLLLQAFAHFGNGRRAVSIVEQVAAMLEEVSISPAHAPALHASFLRSLLASRKERAASGTTTPAWFRNGGILRLLSPSGGDTTSDMLLDAAAGVTSNALQEQQMQVGATSGLPMDYLLDPDFCT